jgi:hypothetical protein
MNHEYIFGGERRIGFGTNSPGGQDFGGCGSAAVLQSGDDLRFAGRTDGRRVGARLTLNARQRRVRDRGYGSHGPLVAGSH